MLANQEIRKAIFNHNIKKWEIAERLGLSDSSFSRKLRTEVSKEEKEQILNIIKELSN